MLCFRPPAAPAATDPVVADPAVKRLLELGTAEFENGRYSRAEEIFRNAKSRLENEGTSGTPWIQVEGNLSSVLIAEGRYDEAELILNRLIVLIKENKNIDRRQLPVILGSLGRLYQQTGRNRQAESTLREALNLGKKFLTRSPDYLSDLQNNLGVLHLKTGNPKQAESDFQKAMSLVPEGSVENEVRRAGITANLAALYFAGQQWVPAQQTLLRALCSLELS